MFFLRVWTLHILKFVSKTWREHSITLACSPHPPSVVLLWESYCRGCTVSAQITLIQCLALGFLALYPPCLVNIAIQFSPLCCQFSWLYCSKASHAWQHKVLRGRRCRLWLLTQKHCSYYYCPWWCYEWRDRTLIYKKKKKLDSSCKDKNKSFLQLYLILVYILCIFPHMSLY